MTATIAAVQRFYEAFNQHDLDAMMAAVTDDCVFEGPYPYPDGTRNQGQKPSEPTTTRCSAPAPTRRCWIPRRCSMWGSVVWCCGYSGGSVIMASHSTTGV